MDWSWFKSKRGESKFEWGTAKAVRDWQGDDDGS